MNAELPGFKNVEHKSESGSALDRDIPRLIGHTQDYLYLWSCDRSYD